MSLVFALLLFLFLVTFTRCFALRFICMNVFLRIHRNPNPDKINTPYVSNLIFAFFCCFTVFARFCSMFCRSVWYVCFFLILIANINPRNPYTICVKRVFVVGLLFFSVWLLLLGVLHYVLYV